jgi:hypothetical protein
VITAAGALAIAVVLGLLPAAFGAERIGLLAALGGIAVITTLIALAGNVAAIWWSIATLGAEYAIFVFGREPIDVRAPIVGAGLIALAELVQWSLRARVSVSDEIGMSVRQLVDLAALWLGSLALGSLVLAVGDLGGQGGLELTIAGVIASGGTLGLVLVLSRRHPRSVSNGRDRTTR